MDTLEFLRRILPLSGTYCAFVGDVKRNEFFDTVESLADYVIKQNKYGKNIYYAISSFKDHTKRTKANSLLTKVITLDIDAKGLDNCYNDVKEAASALKVFLKASKMPPPTVVYSGNGLHVYWVMETALPPEEWNPLNEALRAAATASGLKLDLAASKNGTSLVLRPVGTVNPKGGRTVTLVSEGATVSIKQLTDTLLTGREQVVQTKKIVSSLLDKLSVTSELPPISPTKVLAKCRQVRSLVENRATIQEPSWYAVLGIAAYCSDAEDVAQKWSEGHPGYDPAATLRKMYQWRNNATGPTTCKTFESLNSVLCDGCPFRGTITTPGQLASSYEQVSLANALDQSAQNIKIPEPFKRTKQGIVITINDVESVVCPFDIYPVGYGRDESVGYEVVRYHWDRPHKGWQELKFRQAFLADGATKDFTTIIADQGIILKNKTQTGYFQTMLRSYMDQLRALRGMTNLYATMGWKENYTQFLIGNTLITKAGTSETPLATSSEYTKSMYTTKGNLQDAVNFTSLIDKIDMPWVGNSLLFALCTPMFEFTGLRGITLSLYGQTGTGKTLTQLWQQSLYGDPNKLHGTAKFTQNALFSRLATVRNLPVTVDEATLMQDKDIGEFIMWTTQGRDKARLDKNSIEKEVREWFTTVTLSTNRSMTSLLLDGNMESNAQLARIIEVQVHKHKVFDKSTEAGMKIFNFITNNYGHIGRAFIQRLVNMGEDGIRAAVENGRQLFTKKFSASLSGNERFWETALVLMYVAGTIAEDAGLIKFDYYRCIEWQLKQMNIIRREIRTIKKSSMDYLNEFLNEYSSNTVTIRYIRRKGFSPMAELPNNVRDGVFIRFELYKPDQAAPPDAGLLMIHIPVLRKWLNNRGGDYREFVAEIEKIGGLAYEPGIRHYLTKDTEVRAGQARTLGINLAIPEFSFLITNREAGSNLTSVPSVGKQALHVV